MPVDDIVQHADILSSPSKDRMRVPWRESPIKGNKSRRRCSKSPAKSPIKSLVASLRAVAEEEQVITTPKPEPVVKRKRGRPRKVKIESEINKTPAALIPPKTSQTSMAINPFTDEVKSVVPRKRGRPRKHKIQDDPVVKKEATGFGTLKTLEKMNFDDQSRSESKIGRKTEDGKEETTIPVKRKRGRPRKVPKPEQEVSLIPSEPTKNSKELLSYMSPSRDGYIADFKLKDDKSDQDMKPGVLKTDPSRENSVLFAAETIIGNNNDEDSDVKNSVKLLDGPCTPSKTSGQSGLTTDHDFTSPLKKAIMNNLNEYKDTVSANNLKLSRNFVPTPLPTNMDNHKPAFEKTISAFFDTFEGYFDQKKFFRSSQKSKNTMGMAIDVTREEFALISDMFHTHLHKDARDRLHEIQKKMFPQYWFELTQGFSLLFYGIGSKRNILEEFAFEYLVPKLVQSRSDGKYTKEEEKTIKDEEIDGEDTITDVKDSIPCVVINGYNPTCNYRDVFKDISQALLPEELNRNETKYWGNHVLLQIQKMIELYKNEPPEIKLVLIVHNLDGPSLRKDAFQTMLSYLSLIRQVAIIASVDHIYAPILWDNFKAQNFNFIFHDITNYEPFAVESSFKDVMKMTKNDAASGAEGARFVLQSLTVNSKRMYKLLIETQLSNMENNSASGKVAGKKRGIPAHGVEFKQFLHLCAANFIASNEISLRSMLTEFVEHKMAILSKNSGGTEHVWVSYNYSEMKKLLESCLKDF